MRLADAIKVLATHLGGSDEKDKGIDVVEYAKKLHANEQLSAKQFKAIQEMDDEQRSMIKVLLEAMDGVKAKQEEEEEEGQETPSSNEEDEMTNEEDEGQKAAAALAKQQANKGKTVTVDLAANAEFVKTVTDSLKKLSGHVTTLANEVKALKTNQAKDIEEVIRRREVLARLAANEQQILSEKELEALPTDVLVKLEQTLRPTDYSGMGRFASNMDSSSDDAPLRVNTSLLVKPKKKDEAAKQ